MEPKRWRSLINGLHYLPQLANRGDAFMENHDSYEAGRLFHFDNLFGAGEASYGIIDLRQIGEIACERGYEIALHPQVCMELSYIVSGSGTFQIGDAVLEVRAGDLVFNNPGHHHAIQASASDMLRFVY